MAEPPTARVLVTFASAETEREPVTVVGMLIAAAGEPNGMLALPVTRQLLPAAVQSRDRAEGELDGLGDGKDGAGDA